MTTLYSPLIILEIPGTAEEVIIRSPTLPVTLTDLKCPAQPHQELSPCTSYPVVLGRRAPLRPHPGYPGLAWATVVAVQVCRPLSVSWVDIGPMLYSCLLLLLTALPGRTLNLINHLTLPGVVDGTYYQHPMLPILLRLLGLRLHPGWGGHWPCLPWAHPWLTARPLLFLLPNTFILITRSF